MVHALIHFAPMQGYTDARYRCRHFQDYGGVACYYTPFVRWEREGVRPKDRRDVLPAANRGIPVVPQIIAASYDEFCHLCDFLQKLGWNRIDLNMGCPFPMQTGHGRGAGLLRYPDRVEAMFREMEVRKEVTFSVKMRLGQRSVSEWFALLPLLNASPLRHIALHPRLGIQQYEGEPDMEAFARCYEQCRIPLIYNGDIAEVRQIVALQREYPRLAGVMIGRGLIRCPQLARDYALYVAKGGK